jgi:hypothetical protein
VPALPEAVITAVKSMTPVSLDIIRSIRNADALTANGSVKLIRSNRVGSVKLTK